MFETNTNPFLQLFNPLLNEQGFLGATTQYRSPITASTIMPAANALMTGLTGLGSSANKATSGFSVSNSPSGVVNIAGQGMSAIDGAADAASGLSKAMPFINLGLTGVSTLMAISEAGKAADAQRAADREKDRLVEEARRLKEQNLYAAVQVPVQAYERQFREGTAANAQAINALAQDPRMLLGGVQGVQEATIEGQAKNREALADRLFNKSMTDAGAGMAINQDLSKLNLDEAQGAQIASMAAEKAKIAQQQAALQGVGGMITQGLGAIGTYGGLATPDDKLQSLLGGTVFQRQSPQASQGIDPKMLAAFAQFMQAYKQTV